MAGIMKELNHMLGTNTKLLTMFHLQIDRQTKRMNQELEQYLQMFIDHNKNSGQNGWKWQSLYTIIRYMLELRCHLFKQVMDKTPEWDSS